ncbi:DUF3551 domain-containing protein [Bradyrhizobium sp.]|uniref:DUF3551 domain-containing protein n=1 Tax=Bradyrhizobium sp. TaxID=376 RepID=UPI0026303324|nr:DUF3551 domain-containing protein [Bradyrhizobium sp.]
MLRPALALFAFAAAAVVVAGPARAQTYDPAYPVCMHVFGELEGERMDCIFTSLEHCRASAFGRPAMCLVNPYFAPAPPMRSQSSGRRKH